MEIKNLFEMAKTDRYTADGRAQIEDARKTYQIGEISQATGLQKTANGWVQPKTAPGQKNTAFKGNDARELNSNVQAAAGGKRDVSAENRAFHEKAEKERAERETRANNQASAARKEAEARGLAGVEMKDLFLAKTFEGASVSIAQRGLEAQGFDLLEANDKVNVYERPEGGRITFKLEGNKIKSADYQTPAETAHEGRELPKPVPKREEIGKFYTKFNDAQDAYDAGRQTFPEGGYTIFKTPEGNYKVVDDPKTKQRMQDAGYEVEVDVPDRTKPPKGPIHDSAPLTGDTRLRLSQIQDARKTYQIGEISQATGLQKTANGWVKPKQGAGKSSAGTGESAEAHKKAAIAAMTPEQKKAVMEGKTYRYANKNGVSDITKEDLEGAGTKDSAPLIGDTKIRVRK